MKTLEYGYNILTEQRGIHKDMMMDVGVYRLKKGDVITITSSSKESAALILTGNVLFAWDNQAVAAKRESLFDELPTCVHLSCGKNITITALEESEVLWQQTDNNADFPTILYDKNNVKDVILWDNKLQNTARRILRDIFTYENAPYSNMVMGEVITFPGKWSSYPPHSHDQPEVYYHRFTNPQGFGISIIGDNPKKVTEHSVSVISGGLDHPQVVAPGYGMYYTWMIRHLPNNPWTKRVDNPDHVWLYDEHADIWGTEK